MSDVESNNPDSGLGDLTDWFKGKLSGQETAPAPKAEVDLVTEQADEADDVDGHVESAEVAAPETEDESEHDESPETDDLEEFEIEPGKKVKLAKSVLEQIKPALLRNADYTRKTQEVAEQRRAVEAEAAAARQHRQEYLQGLQVVQAALQNVVPQPADERLWEEDPIEAARRDRAAQQHIAKLQAVHAEQARVMQQHQLQERQNAIKALEEARAKLPDLIPGWRDPAKAEQGKQAVAKYLVEAGYAPEEVSAASDPRAVAISWKAMQYDRIIAARKAAKPVAPKTEKPGPSSRPASDSQALRSKRALAKTGRLDDGFDYFKSILTKR